MATLQCSRCGGTRYDTSHRCEKGCGVMTASNEVESLRERLEKVEAERDELCRDWDSEHYHRLAVERDRDALAAHVERYRSAYVKLTNTSVVNDDWERLLPTALLDEFDRIDDDSPSTSLARRDARVKAEALELASCQFIAESGDFAFERAEVSEWISEKAADYRQQAEGGGDE